MREHMDICYDVVLKKCLLLSKSHSHIAEFASRHLFVRRLSKACMLLLRVLLTMVSTCLDGLACAHHFVVIEIDLCDWTTSKQ